MNRIHLEVLMRRSLPALALVAVAAAWSGCQPNGAYVDVRITTGAMPATPIVSIELDLTLAGNSTTTTLMEHDGRPIQFPTDALLQVVKGTGMLDIVAVGHDASGAAVLRGEAMTNVAGHSVAHADIVLSAIPTGPAPQLTILPAMGAFGKVAVGAASATTTFNITNSGTAPTTMLGVSISGANASDFMSMNDGCTGLMLAMGGGCTVGVQFKPAQAGLSMAQLTVSGGASATAPLGGEGIPPSAFASTPGAGEFGPVPFSGAHNYDDIPFTIMNTGAADSGTLFTSIEGNDAATFAIRGDGCGGKPLVGGASCMLTVRFTPGTRGAKVGTLVIKATPGGLLPVSLAGSGQAPALLTIAPLMTTLNNAVDINTTGSESANLTVANGGDLPAPATVSASDAVNFAITDGCNGAMLNPGSTCPMTVKLAPKSFGNRSTTLTVANGVSGMNAATVAGVGRDSVQLTVVTNGNGIGTVTAPAGVEGTGISCGAACTQHYYRTTANPMVTLSASYDASGVDVAWSAPCTGSTTSCAVTLSTATVVTVTFTKKTHTLTLTRSSAAGGATGTVSGTGLDCGGAGACSVVVNHGDTVALTAHPTAGFFSTWSGGGCGGGALTCTTAPITADTTVNASFSIANLIFTTSTTYTVDVLRVHDPLNQMDGTRGADQFCRDRAAAAGITGRTITSLLTTGTTLAAARLGSARGWVRIDGRPFGDDASTFFESNYHVLYPPRLDEFGKPIDSSYDSASGSGCVNWTSTKGPIPADYRNGGIPAGGGYGWEFAFGMPCNYQFHLYCMSTDYVATVTVTKVPGRIAFLSDGSFRPSVATGGLQGATNSADALCQSEANAAGYSGTFRAFIASANPSTSAQARMNQSGAVWVRPDGVQLVNAPTDLNAASLALMATIQVSPTLHYYGNEAVWTGANDSQSAGTAATTCTPSGGLSWTAPTGNNGIIGGAHFADGRLMSDYGNADCAQAFHLYCFQQ
jgi:hypothetical protein